VRENVIARDVRTHDYFVDVFNAYQGNAFGLAHTLRQSAVFRPPVRAKKLKGLYFVGQYTNPGTGVPMVVLSGKTVARTVVADEC
jgi:phytoene desaturase